MQSTPSLRTLERWAKAQRLPDQFLTAIAPHIRTVELAPGQLLFREGAENSDLFIVGAGSLALEMLVPQRGHTRILTVGPGDLVAWSALLGDRRMTTSAIAVEKCELVAIPADPLLELCDRQPTLGYLCIRAVAQAIARRLVGTRLQLLDLFAETAPHFTGDDDV